jgi:RNA polymerase sigma-70 factor (ECF subfamily)
MAHEGGDGEALVAPSPGHRARGEADAIDALYSRHARQIYNFCSYRLGSPEEAEDATQVTFLNAYRGLQRGTPVELEAAWLFKIAENVCFNSRRSSQRRLRFESPVDLLELQHLLPAADPRPDELFGLGDALASMPAQQRRAILLREWRGLSYKEISVELDLSPSAVETLLFRARRTLATKLHEPPVKRRRRLGALTDVGSLAGALHGLVFAGGMKTAATVATIVAATVLTGSSELRAHRPETADPAPVAVPAESVRPAGGEAREAQERRQIPARVKGNAPVSAPSGESLVAVVPARPSGEPASVVVPAAVASFGAADARAEHAGPTPPAGGAGSSPANPPPRPAPAPAEPASAVASTGAEPQEAPAPPGEEATAPATPVDPGADAMHAPDNVSTPASGSGGQSWRRTAQRAISQPNGGPDGPAARGGLALGNGPKGQPAQKGGPQPNPAPVTAGEAAKAETPAAAASIPSRALASLAASAALPAQPEAVVTPAAAAGEVAPARGADRASLAGEPAEAAGERPAEPATLERGRKSTEQEGQ